MKKQIMIVLMFLAATVPGCAEGIYADAVSIQQGKEAQVQINYEFNNDDVYVGYEFILDMPAGISTVKDEAGLPVYTIDSTNSLFSIIRTTNDGFAALPQTTTVALDGRRGTLMTLTFEADGSLPIGSTHTVTIWHVKLTKKDAAGALHTVEYDNTTFTVTIVERLVTLDETSAEAIPTVPDTNVRVLRTINANEWSTLCLPFAMNGAQVKKALGDDVQIGDLDSYDSEYSGRDVVGIVVNFNTVNVDRGLEANHPYIVKVSHDIPEFRVDGVDIEPSDDPSISIGRRDHFIGTYQANTLVPEFCLFLNGNKFWYSAGKTKMKAFRAYFDFYDVLSNVENASNNISVEFDGTNGIGETQRDPVPEGIYDLQGRKIHDDASHAASLKKGIYIINGKKVTR